MMNYLQINPLRGIAIVLLTVAIPLSFFISCNRDKNDVVEVFFDPQTSFTLKTTNSYMIGSDSGVTQYKMVTPTSLTFSRASEPYSYFPDGVCLEKFDTLQNVEASIKADTAYHYERRDLWEAKGNVDMTNLKGERFQTSQVFWDRQNKIVYSDSAIVITEGEKVTTGIGFRSNEDLSKYEIITAGGKIPVELQRRMASDSIPPPDSANIETIPRTVFGSPP